MQYLLSWLFLLVPAILQIAGLNAASGSQDYFIKNFTTSDGLPHNHVTGIAQDQHGFLWISTWDGLSRFDGYEFKNYYHRPGDSTSIPYFSASKVLVDKYNSVWVAGYPYAVARYNPSTDNFRIIPESEVYHIMLDNQDELWIHVEGRLKKWNQADQCFKSYQIEVINPPENPPCDEVYTVETDDLGNFWLFCNYSYDYWSVYRSDGAGDSIVQFKYIGSFSDSYMYPAYSGNIVRFFPYESDSGHFWLVTGYGIMRHDRQRMQFIPYIGEFPAEEMPDPGSAQYTRFSEALEVLLFPKQSRIVKNGFKGEHISAFLKDRQGVIWLGYYNDYATSGGLARLVSPPKWFTHYFTTEAGSEPLLPFFPILKDREGTVWAPLRNRNSVYQLKKDGLLKESKPLDDILLKSYRHPRSLLEDSAGIWIGYNNAYLVYYEYSTGMFRLVMDTSGQKEDEYSTPSGFVHLSKDGDDLVIFSYHAVYRYNPGSHELKLLSRINENKAIYSMQKDGDKGWIVGYARGIVRYFDRDFRLVSEYRIGSGSFNVEAVCRGDNHDIWAAMLGEGIARIDMATGTSELLTTADGLNNNTTYSILKDSSGYLWITTNQGISRFDPETRQFRQFGRSEGLQIEEFNSDGFYMAPDGEMFFAGMGGVVSFYPDTINQSAGSNDLSPLVVTGLSVSGLPRYFARAVHAMDTLQLQRGDDNFRIGFASLNYRDPEKVRYRYRLSGEDGFTESNFRNRFVSYANLAPGSYLFELEATNSSGEWVSGRSVVIVIPPYYYQTWWFRMLMILLGLLLVSFLVYLYIRQLTLQFRQKQGQLRLESLRGQMNPHFIFNTLNSINYFISQNDRLSANRYIADFSRLMRTILGNMSADYIPFAKECESLHDYLQLEHLRFADKFDYSIEMEEGLAEEGLQVFPGLVQPFVENAIWHGVLGLEGRKGQVRVVFFKEGSKMLRCRIEDDGIGRRLSNDRKNSLHVHQSRGIKIVQERLDIINTLRPSGYKITVEDLWPDREESGTAVTIDIPYKI